MTQIIFSSLIRDLQEAAKTPGHPFRYFTLATTNENGTPRLRTVVLREIDQLSNLIVYTDKRSEKITHINKHAIVSLLFLDKERLIQLSIEAKATLIEDPEKTRAIWGQIPEKSKKDYTSKYTPGKEIKDPQNVEFLTQGNFFAAIRLIPQKIEYLRLKRPNHIRVLFSKEGNDWKSSYLVP
ncbi:pyridoxamine 5'-phosphate oxidase family protein [Aquimarina sp. D1M17]|uniref:pyridoxamine 5'-phosphate oxidase family protein n=1 Tax=Aquimarina acroporae TaxID=2937283 RepID=UPI0020C0590E|nr:pyridoxamine 5'-phosphate oxidase family protein [Aquimarina acroporae]MCK8522064.1 pyridoxamine 5'-phosphate oxidase family protein [Aquimarina acroporae]